MGTAFHRVSTTEMEDKSGAHGIPGITVDGQDVLATYALFRKLAQDVRDGAGPQYVNLETYRFRGHSMSDPVSGTYRSTEEVERRKQEEDPIRVLRDKLFAGGILDQEGLEEMDAEARRISEEAADFADNSPLPDPDALYRNVWAELNPSARHFFDGRKRD
jgi:pyruvate dehydrogenase E1 component alpha subunit